MLTQKTMQYDNKKVMLHTHTHKKIHVDLKYFVSHRKEMHAKKTVLFKKVFCCTKKTLLLHKN